MFNNADPFLKSRIARVKVLSPVSPWRLGHRWRRRISLLYWFLNRFLLWRGERSRRESATFVRPWSDCDLQRVGVHALSGSLVAIGAPSVSHRAESQSKVTHTGSGFEGDFSSCCFCAASAALLLRRVESPSGSLACDRGIARERTGDTPEVLDSDWLFLSRK
jgi:hypothetical protein